MERDDIIEYSLNAQHSEEEGVKIRKKIYFVTILLTVITLVEVAMGVWWHSLGLPHWVIQYTFIALTVVKAGYIIGIFMHLGDERKPFRMLVIVPYVLFIAYFVFIMLDEATTWFDSRLLYNWLF